MLRLIPWYYEVAAVLLLIGVITGAVLGYGDHEFNLGKDFVEAKYEKKYQADLAKATAELEVKRLSVENAHAEDVQRMAVQEAAAAGTRTELGRLRAALANRTTGAPPPAPGPGLDAATLRDAVVAACSGRYEEVAGVAGSLTAKVIGLQNYLRSVGLVPKEIGGGSPQVAGVGSRGALIEVPIQPATAPLSVNSSRDGGAPIPGDRQ